MRIAVVGGGAAGIFGAISAATVNRSAEITVLEATSQPLGKVLISGGGRCNVTHHCFDPVELVKNYPRGHKELLGPFNRFQPRDTIGWFEKHGVRLKVEGDGRMFPLTDKASTIANCLMDTAVALGVKIRLGVKVKSIASVVRKKKPPKFEIEFLGGGREQYDRILLATGNSPRGHRFAEALGHKIVPVVPSLFTFKVSDRRLAGLEGVSFEDTKLTLIANEKTKIEQSGALLITHWGLSGPAVLKLSSWGARVLHESNYRAKLAVNLLPNHSADQLYRMLLIYKEQNGKKRVQSGIPFPIPRKYWKRMVQFLEIPGDVEWMGITKKVMNSIIGELTAGQFAVSGKGIFKEEFVSCGGVSLNEVDFRTMQSKRCPGLYLAGEILDIDGITGGFNFQNAWTTGWIAGSSMGS
jgi:predicted Rossmann fold flavoprotein